MRPKRTRLALAVALSLHALLLWALLRPALRRSPVQPSPATMSLALVGPPVAPPVAATVPVRPPPPQDRAAEPSPPSPAPPPPPEPPGRLDPAPAAAPSLIPPPSLPAVDPTAEPVGLHPSVPVAAPATVAQSAPDCGLGRTVQHALQTDPAVLAALPGIPPGALTPSRGAVLWNVVWIDLPDGRGGASVAPIRRAIVQSAAAATSSCLVSEVRGPVFLYLPAPEGEIVFVVGSGVWRWSDLVASDVSVPDNSLR